MEWSRIDKMPRMRTAMTPFPHFIDIDGSVDDARALMERHGIRHLPVTESGELVGVIGDRDLKRAADPSDEGRVPEGLRVRDLAHTPAYVVGLQNPLDEVLSHMAEAPVDCALVVKDDKLAGIFTVTDACREFARLLGCRFPDGGDDAA